MVEHNHVLTPGRYVGIEEVEEDKEPFEGRMERLTEQLIDYFVKSKKLEEEIVKNLAEIGYEI